MPVASNAYKLNKIVWYSSPGVHLPPPCALPLATPMPITYERVLFVGVSVVS